MADFVLVPGPGRTIELPAATAETVYDVVGPFSELDFIERIDVVWNTNGAGAFLFAASIGGGRQGNAAALEAGRPLVSPGRARIGGASARNWTAETDRNGSFSLPVGFGFPSGSRYLVFGAREVTADIVLRVMVSVVTVRLLRGGRAVPVEEPGR